MTSQRWMLAFCFSLASVLSPGESVTTTETQKYTCRTFGSGVVQPFSGSSFYVRSNCPFTLTRFTHNRVECDITTRRGDNGLLVQVEIIINKVRTVVQNGSILVEKKSVSLPYDHTYQHIFHYGIYTKLKSSLLPLSVTWHNVPGGIDSLWVELDQELSTDMTGLCGNNVPGDKKQLVKDSVLPEDTCQTRDPVSTLNPVCQHFVSRLFDCLPNKAIELYIQLCQENIYGYEMSKYISCAFFSEVVQQCGNDMDIRKTWRSVTKCAEPSCSGDLVYVEQGAAFVPSCSNPNPRFSNQELTSSCVCPEGKVLNDQADGFHCVSVSSCPCVFAGRRYSPGDVRTSKCQSCVCDSGKWKCSENNCPTRCLIEGQFVRTFDGKQYALPGKCTYVASKGLNWTITIKFSDKAPSLETVTLLLSQEMYMFSDNMVKFGKEEITELHQSDHALVFWQSSMYVQVHTSFGMKIQVQVSPEIQLYITPPRNHTEVISGLCGNDNSDTTDDFTTSSRIIENSAQPFAQSWSVGDCRVNIPSTCINKDNEIFADEKCSVLTNPTEVFAPCHGYIPIDHYHTACIQRTCNCGSSLPQCLCVALGSYAKACANLGVVIGDWRRATNCTLKCQKNQVFSYNMQACNHTCRSLSGPDPRCGLEDAPVEGCGCPEGTHLNQGDTCSTKAECDCHYYRGTTPPGPVVIDSRQCVCENGELECSQDCGCRNGKVCVHCSKNVVNTAPKTCDSLSKPMGPCESGCYCPIDQYEDHRGNCVSLHNCTCMYSGKVFSAGQHVKTNCKTCVCGQGQWDCKDEPCPGKCQVYGNGHYQTFDSKWYRFDGQCQYTLVEDDCGTRNGTFSVRVEGVPCCDEALTCSRSIVLNLQGEVTLTLSDMKVTRRHHEGWTLKDHSLYSTHTVGLYIIISVPSRGIILIWDKHTRITIELHEKWRNRVCGLCGNFDFNEMNDLQISGSAVVSSPLAFGNSWKAATPPCSDVTKEIFPCERNSYCLAWAQRRCMIITGDTFKDCHLKVEPDPYYQACVQESCSCEFEGKFLGFCTAVAAYAEACSDQNVCVKWRTPDLCPVYCDFYNEQGQCSWHYEACGEILTCGKDNYINHKLEGCYPRCSREVPYYDENTGECTKLRNCTCYFNDTVIQPRAAVMIQSIKCRCENGTINCPPPPTTTPATTMSTTPTTTALTTTETAVSSTITTPTTTAETRLTTPPTTSTPMTAITNVSTTTEKRSTVLSTSSVPATKTASTTTEPTMFSTITTPTTTAETRLTTPPTTSTPMTAITNVSTTTEKWSTVLSTSSVPATTTASTTTETTMFSTITTPTTTAETRLTTPPTTSTPMTAITNVLTTTEKWSTVLSTSSVPATKTASTTTEPTMFSTITTPTTTAEIRLTAPPATSTPMTTITNVSTTTEKWSTVLSTSSVPATTTASTTTETTMFSTITKPTTAETRLTMPPTTSTPMTAITNVSTTTEKWSTVLSTSSVPATTTASTTTETTMFSTITTPTTTAETRLTTPPTTSTPMTTITNVSTITEKWSTGLSTTYTPTTTSTTTVPSVAPTEVTNTAGTTTSSSTTSSTTRMSTTTSMTTAASTESQPTEIGIPTDASIFQPTTKQPTSKTLQSTTTFETNATSAETSGPTEVTETLTSPTTFPQTSQSHSVTSTYTVGPPTTYTTEMSTTEEFTNGTTTTELTTSEESGTTMTTEETLHTSTPPVCKCTDLKRREQWNCGETWTEDCFHKNCTDGKIELTSVVCPESTIPNCPRDQVTRVSDGCCETWKCDCRCELYGDPHYISFQGVTFDFLDDCTYILVEEQTPRHNLTIAVDNFYCVQGLQGSCAKGIILKYQNNIAILSILPDTFEVQATLNNVTIEPPYEEHGLRFETTGYIVSIYIPEVRSYVSLSPHYNLVVSLAMEHFLNNTQGQCGVCGGGSCIRKGGKIEKDSCCDKTAYDWVYTDPLKPACASAPKDRPCLVPTIIPTPTPCPPSPLCKLLDHPVFSNCSSYMNLNSTKKNCEFDSCRNGPCSSLEQAADECKKAGFCIDWRGLTDGDCEVTCPKGLAYRECHNKLDDFCDGGRQYPGASLEKNEAGCFCPSELFRAGNHSDICVSDCAYCKGPLGEPKLPGEVWQSGCNMCTCNNQTRTEKCFPKPPEPASLCGPNAVLVNTSCCGDQICVEKTCSYQGKTYKVGDRWIDATHPCMSYNCSIEGIQTETRVCPTVECQEEDRIWDDQHCCFTCNQRCAPKVTSISVTVDNCTTVMQIPVCQGQCVSQPSVVLHGELQVEQKCGCCQELSSEKRAVTLQCFDRTIRPFTYKHITSCECRACSILG